MAKNKELYDVFEEEIFEGQVLKKSYNLIKNKIDNLEVRDDDVWLSCFPKTGKFDLICNCPKLFTEKMIMLIICFKF